MATKAELKESSETLEVPDVEQEKANCSIWLERKSFRIALISMFTALAIVLGYLLAYIPNIELFTLTIFLSGFILGKRDGMIVGFLSSFIFCFFNPLGASPLPLFMAQLSHYSITGLIGGLTGNFFQKKRAFLSDEDLYRVSVMILFGLIGALLTSSYQLISTLVEVLSYFGTLNEYLPYFMTGLIFTIVHIVGNTLGFIFILPGLIQLVKKMLF
ncbi:MAG: ECF transporter S component [Promethearchaeota archaeon]